MFSFRKAKRQGRPPAVARKRLPYFLLTAFFNSAPGVNFATLRAAILLVAPVAGFSLRYRECAETNQGYSISLSQGRRNAVHRRVNCGCGCSLTDIGASCNLVDEIGFVHCFSWQA